MKYILIAVLSLATMSSVPAISQTVRLQCNGSGVSENLKESKRYEFSSFLEFNQELNYFNVSRLSDIAPGSKIPYQEILFFEDVIHVKTENNYMGGNGVTRISLNRYNGHLSIIYANFGSSAGIVSARVEGDCTPLNQRQF